MIGLPLEALFGKAVDWVWQASLAGSVLATLILCLQFVFGRRLPARWRYALWLLVVARLLLPMAPASSVSVFNWVGWQSPAGASPRGIDAQGVQSAGETDTLLAQNLAPETSHASDEPNRAASLPALSAQGQTPVAWRTVAGWIWLPGAAVYVLFVLVQHWRMARALKHAKPINDTRFLELLDAGRVALGVRLLVTAIKTDLAGTPAIFGFLRPRLLIPASMVSGWDEHELRHVVLHELVHVRRRDILLNWILVLAQALHWFNPFVWLAIRRLRAEREVLCDAIVLSHLQPAEHRSYGGTLLKVVHTLSKPVRVPSLAPVFNNSNEIERRMTMITQFKPSTRRAALASSVLLMALACFTFTRAADKDAPAPARPEPATSEARRKAEATQRDRSITILEEELAKQRDQVRQKQNKLDQLKEKLMITELDAAGAAAMSAESLRQLEAQRVSTTSEYRRLDSLYQQLAGFSKKELRALLPTASPDPLLNRLLEEEAITDQKLAESGEVKSLSHPEVAGLQRRREKIEKQIDERIDGIMAGLKARLAGLRVQQEVFQAELDQLKKKSIEETISRQPYYHAKRDLETLQSVVERLNARLWQEKVDAALPKAPSAQ